MAVIDWDHFRLSDESYRRLMSYPGVHTISLGRKEVGGQFTDVYAIQVLVNRKLPQDQLTPDQVVPPEIQGVPTDVVEEQEIRLQKAPKCPKVDDTQTHRPLQGGIQVQALHCVSPGREGTLGCIAETIETPKRQVLLSNAHVIGDEDSHIGDDVGQPVMCSVCSGCCSNEVAKVLRVRKTAHVDGAIATLNAGIVGHPQVHEIGAVAGVRHIGKKEAMSASVLVQMRGRTSGHTFGRIVGWVLKKEIKNHNGCVYRIAEDYFRIRVRAPSTCGVLPGDSGSVVLDMDRKVVGLIFGGSPEDWQSSGACPIQFVEDELQITILTANTVAPVTISAVADQVIADFPVHADTRELLDTPSGRMVIELLERHFNELRTLVGTERRATVAWRRNGGPALLQLLGEVSATPRRALPTEIDGQPFENCVRHIAAAVLPFATLALRADLERHLEVLAGSGGQTLGQVIARMSPSLSVG